MIGIGESLGYSVLGIGVVFLMLIILMAIIGVLGKVMAKTSAPAPQAQTAAPVAPAPAAKKAAAPGTAGSIDLYNVEPKTAAMVMAIVADELGAPINELRFVSIKRI